jgi:hypothetical protein
MSPDPQVIEEIASELVIDPAFIEKDWYAVQVLSAVAAHQSDEMITIFSGDTSLSKAHHLIQRFSEDLDFRCQYKNAGTTSHYKQVRRRYRESILAILSCVEHISLDSESVDKGSEHFKAPLLYPQNFDIPTALRTDLQIEFSFTQPHEAPVLKSIQSIISHYTGGEPEVEILCLPPIEIAGDKINALMWRTLKRNRDDDNYDPATIRHLHDLAALHGEIMANPALFVRLAHSAFAVDQKRAPRILDEPFYESLVRALRQIRNTKSSSVEYRKFVDAMSYADDDNTISFRQAMDSFESLVTLFAPES